MHSRLRAEPDALPHMRGRGFCRGRCQRRAPASRETELLKPVNTVKQIHCVMLSGGSAFGLAACDGAMQYLEEKKIGFDVGIGVVPIVCGASLFDLILGDPKKRPDKKMGHEACKAAEKGEPAQGNEGAGTGASVGKISGHRKNDEKRARHICGPAGKDKVRRCNGSQFSWRYN